MLTTKKQLALNLCYLASQDNTILNDMIFEYVELLSDKRFEDMLEYTTNEIRSDR